MFWILGVLCLFLAVFWMVEICRPTHGVFIPTGEILWPVFIVAAICSAVTCFGVAAACNKWCIFPLVLYVPGCYCGAMAVGYKYGIYNIGLNEPGDDAKWAMCLRNILFYSGLSWYGVYSFFNEFKEMPSE